MHDREVTHPLDLEVSMHTYRLMRTHKTAKGVLAELYETFPEISKDELRAIVTRFMDRLIRSGHV